MNPHTKYTIDGSEEIAELCPAHPRAVVEFGGHWALDSEMECSTILQSINRLRRLARWDALMAEVIEGHILRYHVLDPKSGY